MATPTTFNGINLTSVFVELGFPHGNDGAYTSSPSLRQRTNQPPVQEYMNYNQRELPFIAKPTGTVTPAQFRQNVYRYLSPLAGLRPLNALHDDGVTAITVQADIINLQKIQDNLFSGTFLIPDPIWKAIPSTNATTSPISYTGEYFGLPIIDIAPTMGTIRHRIVTVVDNTTRGLFNYPLLISFDSTGVSASAVTNYQVYMNGRSIPIDVSTPNNAATRIWCRIDVLPSGTTTLDLYYGSTISNTLAGTGSTSPFHAGGLDLSSSSNTSWTWNTSTTAGSGIGVFAISSQPTACGVWRPGKTGLTQDNTSFGIVSEAGNQIIFYIDDTTAAANDADCMICVLGVKANAQITGLTRSLASIAQLGGILESFVKYRKATDTNWTTVSLKTWDSTTQTPPQTEAATATAITITDAVEIAIGIQPKEAQPAGTLTLSGAFTIALNVTETPTLTIGAATTARMINGTLTNSANGNIITFTKVLMDNGDTLSIDCQNKTISTTNASWYGTILFNDPDDWMGLEVGSNSWSWSTTPAFTGTTTWTWYIRFLD